MRDWLDVGCIGLCAWRQGQEWPGVSPEKYPGTECWNDIKPALEKKCPEGTRRFVFAKQGSTADNKAPNADAGGRVGNDSITDEAPFNYGTYFEETKLYEWMTGGPGLGNVAGRKKQECRVTKKLPEIPRAPYTIWCASCIKEKKKK